MIPKVSAIIPLYNQAKYVGVAIQSALNQTYPNFEIIVVDDGSTDNSHEVVARFGDKIRCVRQENQGLAGARNTGIRAAKGDFIGLLDADDQWMPNYLETMVSLSTQQPQAAVFYCCARGMDEYDRDLPQLFGGPPRSPNSMYHTLLRANFLIPSTILMRSSVILEAGLFDRSLRSCEDLDLWLRLLPGHDFIGTDACLVRYRLHGNSLSANPSGMQQAKRRVIEKHFGPDDRQPQNWSQEKRRAYGGVYRMHTLSSIQRQGDWQAAAQYLRQALETDPSIATDLDFFYELAFGVQPLSYRGTTQLLNLSDNADRINSLLEDVFKQQTVSFTTLFRKKTLGTAYFALGLVSYNMGYRSLSRRFFMNAMIFRPDLCLDRRMTGDFIRSFFRKSSLVEIKQRMFKR